MKRLFLVLAMLFFAPSVAFAQTPSPACNADINSDAVVDVSDYAILATNFLKANPTNARADINTDGVVDISDYAILATNFLKAATNCSTPTPAATSTGNGPSIQNLATISGPLGKFQKVEWQFDLSKQYANPYYFYDASDTAASNPAGVTWVGADGITVNMHLTSPTGKSYVVPSFWMEDYVRVKDNNFSSQGNEVLGKKDNGHWHTRFTPEESGQYSYFITAQDKTGTSTSGTQTFTVSASASGHGFIRQSSKDPRFLAYEDGTPYIPISGGRQWWNDNVARSFDYENAFTKYGQNGINLTRMWDQIDFALSLEGVGQPLWIDQNTVYGAAKGIEINTANVHSGIRAARPGVGTGWFERIAFAEPSKPHKLTAWIKTASVAGGVGQINIKTGTGFNTGTLLGQTTGVTGTTGWTQYSFTFTPNSTVGSINLTQTAGTGSVYIDDIQVGPTDSGGNITYNIVSDGDFERHFFKGNPNNDPDATPTLARPIGTYMNQWADYEMDKIVESAQQNGIAIQDCGCSGPWFTWPKDPSGNIGDSDWGTQWFLRFNERNFRYRVARWGYSPAILGWELHNEQGHVNPSGTPGVWAFLQGYTPYQKATDPYNHIKTTSQNSQAYSPQMWSSFYDLANYHWYLDGHMTNLDPDEVATINRFAWCLRALNPTNSLCSGLGLGDGTTWSGGAKPWVWGEIGVGLDGTQGNTGVQGSTFLHNKVWAGLFSPLGTSPIEWWWYQEDATATAAKLSAAKAASAFFSGVNFDGNQFTFIMTPTDAPANYTGETIPTTGTAERAYGMRSSDKKKVYVWIANKQYIWSNSGTPSAANQTFTIQNLLPNVSYAVSTWDTTTGQQTSVVQVTSSGTGTIQINGNGVSKDIAFKLETP